MLGRKHECSERNGALFKWRFFAVGAVTLAMTAASPVWAQEQISPVTELVAQNETPLDFAPAEEQVQESCMQGLDGQSIQTITFKKDMPIKDALRMLAQMYQKNIVPSAKVDGIVTVTNLYDVSFEEALQAILGTHKYEARGNFIKIYTNEEFMEDKSRFDHAVIALHYVNSDEAKKLAEPLLSEFGRLGATTAAPTEMEAGKSGDTLAVHDRLVISDYPENIEKIRNVLAEVDVEPLQVLLEVTVMQAKLTETTQFGIDWSNIEGAGIDLDLQKGGFNQGLAPDLGAGGTGLAVGITFDNISAVIKAVETVTDVTIMANPKILALNKQAGKLTIGREDGYLDTTTENTTGSSTQSVAFLETGTILQFRPFIGRDGMIRMEINPEQSDGSVSDTTPYLPSKTTTQIITNVMVQDGQTIVLGGLFQEQTDIGRTQVPVLGDIPIIGELFKNSGDTSTRTELIVLITPHIINSPAEADGESRLDDAMRLANQARQNLHWLSRAKIDEDRYARAVKLYRDGQPEAALAALDSVLDIDRSYLDKVRLKERILRETQPELHNQVERIMLGHLEREESGKWLRR